MKIVLVLLVLSLALASAQTVFVPEASPTVGTVDLWNVVQETLTDGSASNQPACSAAFASTIDPCQVQQFSFDIPALSDAVASASQWISFRFKFDLDNLNFTRAYDYTTLVSIHYGTDYPEVGEASNILDSFEVSPWKNGELDGEYEWNLHCSFQAGTYYMTVQSSKYVQSYNSSLSLNVTNSTESYPYLVQICAQEVAINPLPAWTPFCGGQCLRSESGVYTVESFRDQYSIGAPEHLSAHFSFVAPTATQLGVNALSPGLRLRLRDRVDRAHKDRLGLWIVTVKQASFTSAAFAHPEFAGGYETCPWDFASGPELRFSFDYPQTGVVDYQPDGIDVWIPRCTLEVGALYYVSVLPPHTESSFDYEYQFTISIEVDQINPAQSATLNTGDDFVVDDIIDGFLVPFGQTSDINLPFHTPVGALGHPLSLPFAPVSLWDDGNGPVDRYERSARWYQVTLSTVTPYSTVDIVLRGAQWGRRTDDGQWSQLKLESLTPPGQEFYDYARTVVDSFNLTQGTWLRPDTLDAAMQRFTSYDVDSMRDVDLFVSTVGLPLGELKWVSDLLRYQGDKPGVAPWFEPVSYQDSTGYPNATLENHYGTHNPLPLACPVAEWTCRAQPDRQHHAGDDSTSSCRISLSYCQVEALLAEGSNVLYIGVAPTNLIWSGQDKTGPVTVGPAAPFSGTALVGDITEQTPVGNVATKLAVSGRTVVKPASGNTEAPSQGNWDLDFTLQDMDLRFELAVSVVDNTPTVIGQFPLNADAVEVADAQQGQVDFYVFAVVNQTTNLTSNFSSVELVGIEIELYTALAEQNVWVGVYYFGESDPSNVSVTCDVVTSDPVWQCTTENTAGNRQGGCVFVDQGCDFVPGNYLIVVQALDAGEVDSQTVSYTLSATYLNPVTDLGFEEPANQVVRPGSYNHYIFDVPDNNQTVALRVHIADVRNGKVTAYLRYGGPAGDDQCLLFDYLCQPSGGYSECDLIAPYCINGAGQYYVSVLGDDSSSRSSDQIAYVLSAFVHHAEWVDWMPPPDANDPSSAVHITRSIPAGNTYAGIIKFADGIVKPDVRYNFWNNDNDMLNPALPGLRQPIKPVAGFRPFGYLSFGMYGAGPNAVLGAEAHYYYFELTAAQANFSDGTVALVSSITTTAHSASVTTSDTLSLLVSPYALATDLCNCWSCTAQLGDQHYSHCDVVLQECDLLPQGLSALSSYYSDDSGESELWYLTVQYDQYDTSASLPIDYTLDVQLKGVPDMPLVDGQAVYSSVAANEYHHYYFAAPQGTANGTASLNVQLYVNRDQVDQAEFAMNVGSRAGTACPDWNSPSSSAGGQQLAVCETAPVTQGNTEASYATCTFKINPCDFDASATYWFSVAGLPATGSSLFGGQQVEYTLRVWLEDVVALATDGSPVSGLVTETNVYSVEITADFFSAGQAKHLFVQLDGVAGGEVKTWWTKNRVGSSCQLAGCPGDRRAFDGEFEIELDNCQLTQGDVYYLSVSAASFDDSLAPVRYTLRAYSKLVTVQTLTTWGRNVSTSVSLGRLQSVAFDINIGTQLTQLTSRLSGDALAATLAAASVHVRVFDVTWGTLEYWVSSTPKSQASTRSYGSYPYGLASPECHTQYGGVTGQDLAYEPDLQHSYEDIHPGRYAEKSDFDAVRTFGEVPPNELYLRLGCDVKSIDSFYVTLHAAVAPEFARLPCDRVVNASVSVWVELPTLLVQPEDVWTFTRGGVTDLQALTWVQAPENLTIWGDDQWRNDARLFRPTQLVWSQTYSDEYKLFAYPIDFSKVDSVGIYLTSDRKIAPSIINTSVPYEWTGFDIPKDTVFGDAFEYYWVFVASTDLQASAVGNAATPGRISDSCGFAPEHYGESYRWSDRESSGYATADPRTPIVLTACQYGNEAGVFFLAVRYPTFTRPLAPYVAPAVAVAWQFPNSITPDVRTVSFGLPLTADLLKQNTSSYLLTQNFSLGMYDRLNIEFDFPAAWDTDFPYWSYQVQVQPTFINYEAVPVFTYDWTDSPIDLYAMPVDVWDANNIELNDAPQRGDHFDGEYHRGARYALGSVFGNVFGASDFDPAFRECAATDYLTNDFFVGGGTVCCRQSELMDSRKLVLSFANNRQVKLIRGSWLREFNDTASLVEFTVRIAITPFYLPDFPVSPVDAYVPGPAAWVHDPIYMMRTYKIANFDPSAGLFNFEAYLTNNGDTAPSVNFPDVVVYMSYETIAFGDSNGFAVFQNDLCYSGGDLICSMNPSESQNASYPFEGGCFFNNVCDLPISAAVGTYYLTFRFASNAPGYLPFPTESSPSPDALERIEINFRLWQTQSTVVNLTDSFFDSTDGFLPPFVHPANTQVDVTKSFIIGLPPVDPAVEYSRFVWMNPAKLQFNITTFPYDGYCPNIHINHIFAGLCGDSGDDITTFGWECNEYDSDWFSGSRSSNCTFSCEIALCALDGQDSVEFGVIFGTSGAAYTNDAPINFTFSAEVIDFLDRAVALEDGVYTEVNSNLTDVETQFYYDYDASTGSELSYLEFGLLNVSNWFLGANTVVLRVWPDYLCETNAQARTCSAVPTSADRFGAASCVVAFDPCEFDYTRNARFFVSATIGFDNFTVAVDNPQYGLWQNFTFAVVASVRQPTLVETVALTAVNYSSGFVLFDTPDFGTQQHHYRFAIDSLASDYESLEVCVQASCEAAEFVSPYKWEVELEYSTATDGSWMPPFEPYVHDLSAPYSVPVVETYKAFTWVASTSSAASIHAFLHDANATTPDSHVTLYLFQSDFSPAWSAEKARQHLVSVQLITNLHPVQLTAGVTYFLVASQADTDTYRFAFSVRYLYEPALQFSVNARYFNWEHHWATPTCNEFHAGLSAATKWVDDSSSACFSLSACDLQSGDVYVSVIANNHPYPFVPDVNNDVRYELTVSGRSRPKPQTIGLNQWVSPVFAAVDDSCNGAVRAEVVVPITGLQWGSSLRIEAISSSSSTPSLIRACPRWRNSNLVSLYDAENFLDAEKTNVRAQSDAEDDVYGAACSDYSLCTVLTDVSSSTSSTTVYSSTILTPCGFDNTDLFVSFESSSSISSISVRLSVDNGWVPFFSLQSSASSSVSVPGQIAAGQWQFYKFAVGSDAPRFSVSLSERTGGDAFQLTLSSEYRVPALPSSDCFDESASCPANSDSPCQIAVPWCEAGGAVAYYVGVFGRSSVNAVMSYTLTAERAPADIVDLQSCDVHCFSIAKGDVAYVRLDADNLAESLALFDVRDLDGVIEIAVEQYVLPTQNPACHIGSTWLIDSSDLSSDGSTVHFDDFDWFANNDGSRPFGPEVFTDLEDATFNLPFASYLGDPDARRAALERDIEGYSAFRYALPCLANATTYLAFFALEDATFSFSYRAETLVTAANTLSGPSASIGWRPSPLDGFVQTHLVPFASTLLNDFSACQTALTQTGQWPHLYKWEYTSAWAANRQAFGWNLDFKRNAELSHLNRGILVVNENRVAAPILAGSSSQSSALPGLNPLALQLAHFDDCSVYPPSTLLHELQPASSWSYTESCDLQARTLYFYVLFDYSLNEQHNFSFPLNTTDGRWAGEEGTTTSFTSTVTSVADPHWSSVTPISTNPSSTHTLPVTTAASPAKVITSLISPAAGSPTKSVVLTPPASGVLYDPNMGTESLPLSFGSLYDYEYTLSVFVEDAPEQLVVGGPVLNITACQASNASVLVDLGSTTSYGPLSIDVFGITNGATVSISVETVDEYGCSVTTHMLVSNCTTLTTTAAPGSVLLLNYVIAVQTSYCDLCSTFSLEAYWNTDEVPSAFVPSPLPTSTTPVHSVSSSIAVTSFNHFTSPVRAWSLPTVTAAFEFIHVRLSVTGGQNVFADLFYADLTNSIASCSGLFAEVPFYSSDFSSYWLNRTLSPIDDHLYSHGLYGQCEIYISPADFAVLPVSTTGPSFFVSASLDPEQALGIDIASAFADFDIVVTTGFTPAPTASPVTYALSGLGRDFFVLTTAQASAVVFQLTSLTGPAVRFTIRDSPSEDVDSWVYGPVWCLSQTCSVELNSQSQLSSYSNNSYYVFVDRDSNTWQKDSVYSLVALVGAANGVNYNETVGKLDFCSIVQTVDYFWNGVEASSNAWNYGDFTAKDNEAAALFTTVIDSFWGSPSEECIHAVAIWSCFQTIREIDSNGFVLPVCQDECLDVVAACGEWTTSAALPQFDCGSSRYYSGPEVPGLDVCTGSNNRTVPVILPPPFYINGSNASSFVYSLTTTTGTTTSTTSSTSSTTTTGTDGHNNPYNAFKEPKDSTSQAPKIARHVAEQTTAPASFGFLSLVAVVVGALLALTLVVLAIRKLRRA